MHHRSAAFRTDLLLSQDKSAYTILSGKRNHSQNCALQFFCNIFDVEVVNMNSEDPCCFQSVADINQ